MKNNSRTLFISENFNSRIISHPSTLKSNSSLNMNMPRFHHESYDTSHSNVKFPLNDGVLMRNFRKNFINDAEEINIMARGNNRSQRRISEYFPEVKNSEKQVSSQGKKNGKAMKRSLESLQMKYNSVNNMVSNLSNNASYSERISENEFVSKIKKSQSSKKREESKIKPSSSITKLKSDEIEKENPKCIHLVGHVDNVLRWNHLLKETGIRVLYNVLGYFISVMEGLYTKEKFVYIRNNAGIILECSYFEIDRSLPKLRKDQFVGCFGHVIGPQRFRLFSIEILHDINPNDVQRAIYLSQRLSHEFSNRISN